MEQRRGGDKRIVVKGALFGPPAWRDADGFSLCFVGTWTVEEKVEVLRAHLGVRVVEARRLAVLDEKCHRKTA